MKLSIKYFLYTISLIFLFALESQAQTILVDTTHSVQIDTLVKIKLDTTHVAYNDTVSTVNVPILDTLKVVATEKLQPIDTVKFHLADTIKASIADTIKTSIADTLKATPIDRLPEKQKADTLQIPPTETKMEEQKKDSPAVPLIPKGREPLVDGKAQADTVRRLKEQDVTKDIDTVSIEKLSETQKLIIEKKLMLADSLRKEYDFAKALDVYSDLQKEAVDSLLKIEIESQKILCENGLAMTAFVATPTVVARQKFSLEDFYLYYPLPDKTWRRYPNILDSLNNCHPRTATFVRDDDKKIFFAATDENGINNIYLTEKQDSVWTYPTLTQENLTTDRNEIFPMLSKEGQSLYFSSEGLYGMGGYDLFVSNWNDDTEEWSAPINLGFPFSSPANDYLLVHTDDSKYTLFASDRGCDSDSVWVYVLDYEELPIRKHETDPAVLKELSQLIPTSDPFKLDAGAGVDSEITENKDVQKYMEKMSEVNMLRDSIDTYNRKLDGLRNAYAISENVGERERLTNEIINKELKLNEFQNLHNVARIELHKIEMDFLHSGVVIDLELLMERADREIVGESTNYTFAKRNYGDCLNLKILPPPAEFDYSFKILDTAEFATNNTLPDGLIYQIQVFSQATKANVVELKGLSPVFETAENGKFIYRVGLFTTHNDVLSNLNKVKKAGFKTAFIVAFNNGAKIAVPEAKKIETEQ